MTLSPNSVGKTRSDSAGWQYVHTEYGGYQ